MCTAISSLVRGIELTDRGSLETAGFLCTGIVLSRSGSLTASLKVVVNKTVSEELELEITEKLARFLHWHFKRWSTRFLFLLLEPCT